MTSGIRHKGIFYGWYIVGATWAINVQVAATYVLGMGLFFNPIRTELGWNAATTSLAFSLRQLETGFLAPVSGFLIDRLGSRNTMLVGLFVLGLGFILLGRVQSLWQFYAVFLLISIGPSLGYLQAMNASIVNWFRRHRVRALGLMMTGGSLGGVLLPVVAFLVSSVGWRTTATICGIVIWVGCLPLAALVRHRPEPYGWAPDGDSPPDPVEGTRQVSSQGGTSTSPPPASSEVAWTVQTAIRTRTFWIITLAQAAYSLALSMVLTVHLIPFMESLDVPRAQAASLITIFMLSTLPARLTLSLIGDRFEKRRVLAVLYGSAASGVLVLSFSHGYWQALPYSLLAGFGHGGITILTVALISESFGTRRYASIHGVMQTFSVLGGVAGPFAGGLVFDVVGSYRPAFLTVAILAGMMAPLILLVRQPRAVTAPVAVASGT